MIRPAIPEDGPALMEMGAAFFEEAGHGARFEFDPESFARTLVTLGQNGLLLVVEKAGVVVGMAAADVAPAFWNHKVMLGRECFWFIMPGHRTGLGRTLIPALEAAARDRGATVFDVVAETGKRSDALARMYRAGGFSPAETTFRKVL